MMNYHLDVAGYPKFTLSLEDEVFTVRNQKRDRRPIGICLNFLTEFEFADAKELSTYSNSLTTGDLNQSPFDNCYPRSW
jgi:cytidine deaminase